MIVRILEPTQLPEAIRDFIRCMSIAPDFYGLLRDMYILHAQEHRGGCTLYILKVIDGYVWVMYLGSERTSSFMHQLAVFVHQEEEP